MMEIRTLTVADLKTALESEEFWQAQILPITKHRALSFSRNPRAAINDPVLLVAYQDNRVVGYLGILPDKLFINDVVYKLGWLTSWWVDPSFKTAGVGAILLFKALNAYDQYIGLSGSSKDARKALDASQRFMEIDPLPVLDIRLRSNLTHNMPLRFRRLKPFRLWYKILDAILNEVMNRRQLFWHRRENQRQQLTYEYISAIDKETDRFIHRHYHNDLTRKDMTDLSWIMNNPWIIPTPRKDLVSQKYYFSSRADRFLYLGVKVYQRQSELIGFILLKVRDKQMSVVYSYFNGRHAVSLAAAAVEQAQSMDVNILSLHGERLIAGFAKLGCPCWSVKKKNRGFSLSKTFADIPLGDYRLQGGDGDLAFY